MNVYDFDETIYDGDSTRDFIIYLFLRDFSLVKFLPKQFLAFLSWQRGKITKTEFKEKLFSMFSGVEDIDRYLHDFWQKKQANIKSFYLLQKREDDLIISASPEFLLLPICNKLGISLIASRVDKFTGKYEGENCFGEEKVARFLEQGYDVAEIDAFYSDSYSDSPLADLAKVAYLVDNEIIKPW